MSSVDQVAQTSTETQPSELSQTKTGILSWFNNIVMGLFAYNAVKDTKTVKAVTDSFKSTKAAKAVASKTAKVLKRVKSTSSTLTKVARGLKYVAGVATGAGAFTAGTSWIVAAGAFAASIAVSYAAELAFEEVVDAGITMANGGEILEESQDDFIKLGDWIGQGAYQLANG